MARSSSPSSEKKPDGRASNGKNLKPHHFKPGQSGNPSGFNNYHAFAKAAREHTTEALEVLVKCMRQTKFLDIRMRAAAELLNRGWGKPKEQVEINTTRYVAVVPMPLDSSEAWLAAVQGRKTNGHGVTIEASPKTTDPLSLPGSPSPSSKLNS